MDNVTICQFNDNFSNSFLYLNLIYNFFFVAFHLKSISVIVQNKPRLLEFGGSIIRAFNYFLLILRPYHLNGMLFSTRF